MSRYSPVYTNLTSVSEPLSAPCFSNNNEKYFHASDFVASYFFNVNYSGVISKTFLDLASTSHFVDPSFTAPTVFLHEVHSTNDHAVRIPIDECANASDELCDSCS